MPERCPDYSTGSGSIPILPIKRKALARAAGSGPHSRFRPAQPLPGAARPAAGAEGSGATRFRSRWRARGGAPGRGRVRMQVPALGGGS